jgi:hypothetical protein
VFGTACAKLARSKLMALVSLTGKTGSHQLICCAGALYQTSRCHGKAKAIPVVRWPTGKEVRGFGTS